MSQPTQYYVLAPIPINSTNFLSPSDAATPIITIVHSIGPSNSIFAENKSSKDNATNVSQPFFN